VDAGRLDRITVDVAGALVEISWAERDELLFKLRFVAGCETIVEKFEAVGANRPVVLDDDERLRLRVALEVWKREVMPPGGFEDLLATLVRADTGGL
jgi:hypothetical protein